MRFVNLLQRSVFICNIQRDITTTLQIPKGHSKWQNIQGTKTKKDMERGKEISAFLQKLKVVAKEGYDPKFNKKLETLQKDYLKKSLPLDTFTKHLEKLKTEAGKAST